MIRLPKRSLCVVAWMIVAAGAAGIPLASDSAPVSKTPAATDAAPGVPAARVTPEPDPAGRVSVGSPGAQARQLLDRALRAMGGERAVDGVETLVLDGAMHSATGGQSVRLRVTLLFPDKARRDLMAPAGETMSTVFTPEGAFLVVSQGSIDLPPAEQEKLETAAMRDPLSLLKARSHPLFGAAVGEQRRVGGILRDVLLIRIALSVTRGALDSEGRMIEVSSFEGAKDQKKVETSVRYSDFRRVGEIVYPFGAESVLDGRPSDSVLLDSVKVNEPVSPVLFQKPPAAPPFPTPSPAAPASPL